MGDISFSSVKIHNEIELLAVTDMKVKRLLEHLFLENRISYYEKWEEISFIRRFFWGGFLQSIRALLRFREFLGLFPVPHIDDAAAGNRLAGRVEMIRRRVEKTYF